MVYTQLIPAESIDLTKAPSPFVKWVGGKRGIIQELTRRLPHSFKSYYEPFVGGGALFFELCRQLKKAFLSDVNVDLVITFNVIRRDPQKLIARLNEHAAKHNEAYYYTMRSQHYADDPIELAARFIYLNKTCYNGLFRANKKGEFNVPVGRYENPPILDEENLLLCHEALQRAVIEYKDFAEIAPKANDFVYFDPPYHPTDENSFTKYSKSGFTEHDQARLKDFALALHKKGVKVMISNSDTKFIRDLYKSRAFNIESVSAPRLVNCKAEGRKAAEEVLIRNYAD